MKRSEAIKKLDDWFKLVEGREFPYGIKSPGQWLLSYLENHLDMRPPYDSSQDDGVDTEEWEPENV